MSGTSRRLIHGRDRDPGRDHGSGRDSSRGHGRSEERPHAGRVTDTESGLEIDSRKASILNAVVSEYIETAQPVGSAHVTGLPGVEVSSATVRSEMAALEREGYLVQPHTSAGRVPTDKGYRFFVDHLGAKGRLGPDQRQQVRSFYAHVHGEVEELLERTSGLLAGLTDYASVVIGAVHDSAPVCSVQLVGLSAGVVLMVVVLGDGTVEKRTIELDEDLDARRAEEALATAGNLLTAHARGHPLSALSTMAAPASGDPVVGTLLETGMAVLAAIGSQLEPEKVFVGGSSRMALAFDAVETVRSVLSILEQQLVVVELMEDILDSGMSVAIGAEHGFEPLASCALVISPVAVDGEPVGTVGVVGPTRMNYPKALAAVEAVGQQLGLRLERYLMRAEGVPTESQGMDQAPETELTASPMEGPEAPRVPAGETGSIGGAKTGKHQQRSSGTSKPARAAHRLDDTRKGSGRGR